MNRINRKVEYALMALKHMSTKVPGELTTAKEVSESFRAPFDATARVMQVMAQRGLLRSEQGVLGGYQISRDLAKVSFLDLINIIDGPNGIVKCVIPNESCEIQEHCNIITPVTILNQKLNDFYSSIKLKDILLEAVQKNSKREMTHG